MRKILIVVYSWTGTSHRLAESLAASQRWTLAEIRDAGPGRTAWRCVVDSLLRRRPVIRYDSLEPRGFDAVVLISPIWVGRLAGPMRSFIAGRAASLPPVVSISVMGGGGATNALKETGRLLQRAPIVDAVFTQREIEDGKFDARLEALGKAVDSALMREPGAPRPAVLSGA